MPAYAKGRLAWGQCMRCGLRYLLRQLVLDGYYPNIRVCLGCYDAPQPQERLAVVSDPVALWKPAPDSYQVTPPFLTAVVGTAVVFGNYLSNDGGTSDLTTDAGDRLTADTVVPAVILSWTSIGGPPVGSDQVGGQSAQLSAGYIVNRSIDGGITFQPLANLVNTADEFGALAIETLTYTDVNPPVNNPIYSVLGYDVLTNAEYG